jgi:hypothetical protein
MLSPSVHLASLAQRDVGPIRRRHVHGSRSWPTNKGGIHLAIDIRRRRVMTMNQIAEARLIVGEGDSARVLAIGPEDSFPDVFATSRMVALMEIAAARAMRDVLREGSCR